MRVLAIDPGYHRVGIAVVEKSFTQGSGAHETWIFSETFSTRTGDDINARLFQVGEHITSLCTQYNVEYLAIEKLFFNNNEKTVMHVAEVRGIIMFAAHLAGVEVVEYTPLQIKAAITGNGRADKRSVIDMVGRLVTIPSGKRLDDEYDAIACALTFFAYYRNNNISKLARK